MIASPYLRLLGVSCLTAAALTSATAQSSFQGLGFLSGNPDYAYSEATGISGDGSTVIGHSIDDLGNWSSFRWTAAEGMIALPVINSEWSDYGMGSSEAAGVSYDGSVIVGTDYNLGSEDGGTRQAYRWTAGPSPTDAGTITGLPYSDPTYSFMKSYAVSADGNVVVGESSNGAFRWTAGTGTVILTAEGYAVATGVSADGSVVVGFDSGTPFRWTESGGLTTLSLPGDDWAEPTALSADGSTIVGNYNGNGAFVWTESGGFRMLDPLPDATEWSEHHVLAVSEDGRWAVGHGGEPYAEIATMWDTATAFAWDLNALFAEVAGFEGWQLQIATGISADGLTISGWGLNPDGISEAWIGTLASHPTAVPEPATYAAIAGALMLGLAVHRRRQLRRAGSATTAP